MEKKHIEIKNKTDCTGGRACELICPQDAIKMKEDKEGFLYPIINKDKCINCGMCLRKCHINKNEIRRNVEPQFLEVKPIESLKAKQSTSGGLAQIISEYIISEEGFVYDAILDEELKVKHIGVNNVEDLAKLRGSKNVISNTEKDFQRSKRKIG